jgi:hypothetical protein
LAVFAVIGTLGLLIPLIIYLAAGERGGAPPRRPSAVDGGHGAVLAVLFWVIGAKPLSNGLSIVFG